MLNDTTKQLIDAQIRDTVVACIQANLSYMQKDITKEELEKLVTSTITTARNNIIMLSNTNADVEQIQT